MKSSKELANEIFYKTEMTVYEFLEKINDSQYLDKSIIYIFFKAFYLHVANCYIKEHKININFNEIYTEYKEYLKDYYKKNNSHISNDILNDLLESFDKCFEMIETINFIEIDDGYEFRHHIISVFELLKIIIESKSKNGIRPDIFDNYITKIKDESENILYILE